MEAGIVFNIQRYTIHDGPGIRTEVFLKGCPLSCLWCSNPESQDPLREPAVYPKRCIGRGVCGECRAACPVEGCISFGESGAIAGIDRDRCIRCGICIRDCPAEALRFWGRKMTVDEVMETVLKDEEYYRNSGGGVTISGGEPLLQAAFTGALLDACRARGIHSCVETTFYASEATAASIYQKADLLISDIKFMDADRHKQYTGVENGPILKNLKAVTNAGKPLILRIPYIPGINSDEENLEKTAAFILGELGNRIECLEILPFMHMGEEKCRSLGRRYPMKSLHVDAEALRDGVAKAVAYFNGRGIRTMSAGS